MATFQTLGQAQGTLALLKVIPAPKPRRCSMRAHIGIVRLPTVDKRHRASRGTAHPAAGQVGRFAAPGAAFRHNVVGQHAKGAVLAALEEIEAHTLEPWIGFQNVFERHAPCLPAGRIIRAAMNAVPMSQQEAVDMLRKWMSESRVIHFTIGDLNGSRFVAKLLGRIDKIEGDMVYCSMAQSTVLLGNYILLQFAPSECIFEYSDAEHAPEPLRSQLRGHDAIMYIYLIRAGLKTGIAMGLAVLPEINERAKL